MPKGRCGVKFGTGWHDYGHSDSEASSQAATAHHSINNRYAKYYQLESTLPDAINFKQYGNELDNIPIDSDNSANNLQWRLQTREKWAMLLHFDRGRLES